ncbi:MAG TPA: TnsA endonuclease C-terminal domain-containing protein [Clostridium sp.]|uniref:TnsA endonuclease C-terminal domain-containing protein n=1 Tax=Clostridium sp. TaxID=1506 RepID=UPI002F94CD59
MTNGIFDYEKEAYVPGIKVQDFSSRGRVSRIKGKTTNRIHHLISDLQTNLFYLLDYEESITDIKEHYPLLDLEEVVSDLADIRLDKFIDKKTGEKYVFTTTFVITLKSMSGEKYLALSVRNESELYRDLTLEKLELERRYWNKKRIGWAIITNKDLPMIKVKNIKWLYLGYTDIDFDKEQYIRQMITSRINLNQFMLKDILSYIDKELLLIVGTSLGVLKNMIIDKELIVNMDIPIDIEMLTSDIIVNFKEVTKRAL